MTSRGILREGALWGTAAAVVLAAHLGGAIWVLQRAEAAAPPGVLAPVFVELAPMPEAAAPLDEVETTEMAEAAPEPEAAPDFVLDQPLPELEPLPDMASLFPPPPDAVVLKKPEPKKAEKKHEPEPKIVKKEPEPKKPEKKTEKKEKSAEEQPSRKATTRVQAQPSNRTAAPSAQGGQPSAKQVASWQSKVQSKVNRHMQRARLGRSGVSVTIAFTITASGQVSGGRLAGSTGDAKTDAALSRQAASLPKMPAHPSGRAIPVTLPVTIKR